MASSSDKPGRSLPSLIRWTRYGRWSDDGSSVLNNRGEVIYRQRVSSQSILSELGDYSQRGGKLWAG